MKEIFFLIIYNIYKRNKHFFFLAQLKITDSQYVINTNKKKFYQYIKTKQRSLDFKNNTIDHKKSTLLKNNTQ